MVSQHHLECSWHFSDELDHFLGAECPTLEDTIKKFREETEKEEKEKKKGKNQEKKKEKGENKTEQEKEKKKKKIKTEEL